jgi:integrase
MNTLPEIPSIFERMKMARRRGQRKGELWERSGSWLLRYYVDDPEKFDPKTGRPGRSRITVTVAPSKGPGSVGKREAQRIAWDEYLSMVDTMSLRPSSMRTFAEFVRERYTPDVLGQPGILKPATRVQARSILKAHVLPALGSVRLRDISVSHVQALCNAKAAAGLSTQTVKNIKNRISAILTEAKRHGWYAGELPTTMVRLPHMQRKERHALTWEQVCALSRELPEPIATLVLFLTLTGLRIGEAMGLCWKRVNLTAQPIIVNAEIIPPMSIAVRENYVLRNYQTLKTAKSVRNVPIPMWFVPRLAALSSSPDGSAVDSKECPVFANGAGKAPVDEHNTAARFLKPAAKRLGLLIDQQTGKTTVSWHVFRHTYATLTDQANFTASERQHLLGHANAAQTMHYTHAVLESLRPRLEVMVDPGSLTH